MRKLREKRDEELKDALHEKDQELGQIRTEREQQLAALRAAGEEEMDKIQTEKRNEIQELTAKRAQCDTENDEVTCRAAFDVKIDDKRVYFEEQAEILRENRDRESLSSFPQFFLQAFLDSQNLISTLVLEQI